MRQQEQKPLANRTDFEFMDNAVVPAICSWQRLKKDTTSNSNYLNNSKVGYPVPPTPPTQIPPRHRPKLQEKDVSSNTHVPKNTNEQQPRDNFEKEFALKIPPARKAILQAMAIRRTLIKFPDDKTCNIDQVVSLFVCKITDAFF
jgi:hypothetical protein